ncbi:hypothetical protein ONZ45_g19478 [Pleurotus djamor]|nr:hypothetical protein ONZ45_g19478 [Pleurotus djamor]
MSQPPPSKVVSTHELLQLIFEYLDTRDNLRNALVSKTWAHEALRMIWRTVTDFRHLAALLAPIEATLALENGDTVYPEDWVRWDAYAWRVQTLADRSWHLYAVDLLRTMCQGRSPSEPLLPSLRTLEYPNAPLDLFPFFVTSKLQDLTFNMTLHGDPAVLQSSIKAFLGYINEYAPNLQNLHMWSNPLDVKDIESDIASSLAKLLSLKNIYIPINWVTETITRSLALLPKLEVLSVLPPATEVLPQHPFTTTFKEDDFPALRNLAIFMPLERARLAFSHPNRPKLVEVINITHSGAEAAESYTAVLKEIPAQFPLLTDFALVIGPSAIIQGEAAPVTFQTLEPLLQYTKLTSLKLHHISATFEIDGENLCNIVTSLPKLTVLHLNPTPYFAESPILSIVDILPLRRIRPELEELALYVDAARRDMKGFKGDGIVFEQLKVFSVGFSPIAAPVGVALFLSRIITQNCARNPSYQL